MSAALRGAGRKVMECEHAWEPVPGEMGQYSCASCGAHGQRGWQRGGHGKGGWRGGGIVAADGWWRSAAVERAEDSVGRRARLDEAEWRGRQHGPVERMLSGGPAEE